MVAEPGLDLLSHVVVSSHVEHHREENHYDEQGVDEASPVEVRAVRRGSHDDPSEGRAHDETEHHARALGRDLSVDPHDRDEDASAEQVLPPVVRPVVAARAHVSEEVSLSEDVGDDHHHGDGDKVELVDLLVVVVGHGCFPFL